VYSIYIPDNHTIEIIVESILVGWSNMLFIHRKRFDITSYVRCLTEDIWDEADLDDNEDAEDGDAMDIDNLQLKKPGRHYRNQVYIANVKYTVFQLVISFINCM
jgi:hypothetical protein